MKSYVKKKAPVRNAEIVRVEKDGPQMSLKLPAVSKPREVTLSGRGVDLKP